MILDVLSALIKYILEPRLQACSVARFLHVHRISEFVPGETRRLKTPVGMGGLFESLLKGRQLGKHCNFTVRAKCMLVTLYAGSKI